MSVVLERNSFAGLMGEGFTYTESKGFCYLQQKVFDIFIAAVDTTIEHLEARILSI